MTDEIEHVLLGFVVWHEMLTTLYGWSTPELKMLSPYDVVALCWPLVALVENATSAKAALEKSRNASSRSFFMRFSRPNPT